MNIQGHGEGQLNKTPEAQKALRVEKLTSEDQIRQAVMTINNGNLLTEGEHESSSQKGKWLEKVRAEIIDAHGAALAIKEGDTIVGVIVANKEGQITQFHCMQGKEREAFEQGVKGLEDKDIKHITVRVSQHAERMVSILRGSHFSSGEVEKGKYVFRKG